MNKAAGVHFAAYTTLTLKKKKRPVRNTSVDFVDDSRVAHGCACHHPLLLTTALPSAAAAGLRTFNSCSSLSAHLLLSQNTEEEEERLL